MSTPLKAGSATVEITPPLEVGFLLSAIKGQWQPFSGIRQPLKARVLLFESNGERCAWVSADLLGFSSAAFGAWFEFKQQICHAAGPVVSPQNLLLTATHTHSAPETLGLTDLPRTKAFATWRTELVGRLSQGLREAAEELAARRLGIAQTDLKGLTINRRVQEPQGVELSTFADTALVRRQADKPKDDSIWVAAFTDEAGKPRELFVNATCHPVYEMCLPEVSPDFPGEMSAELQRMKLPARSLFFNGAAGNVNPLVVSAGSEPARLHGQKLAKAVADALLNLTPVEPSPFLIRHKSLRLRCRPDAGWPDREWVDAELKVVRIGPAVFLFLPGEPFVETGLACRLQSPFPWTAVIGYAEDSVGYIPTEKAFAEGGYETGPGRWSFLDRGCEPAIRAAANELISAIESSPQ